jgi:hypothetical protein
VKRGKNVERGKPDIESVLNQEELTGTLWYPQGTGKK